MSIFSFRFVLIVFLLLFSCCKKKSPKADTSVTEDLRQVIKYRTEDIYIPQGGNLFTEMIKKGLTPQQIIDLTLIFGDNVDFRTVQPNDHFQLVFVEETNELSEFNYQENIFTIHRIIRDDDNNLFRYAKEEKITTKRILLLNGEVLTTFIQSLNTQNIDDDLRYAAANALGSRINFAAHTRSGDTYTILYEERTLEGSRVPGSKLLYAAYQGKQTGFHEGFRYTAAEPQSVFNGMYTSQGQSMLIANFRWPLDRIHVSSGYGNRFHPIYRKWQMHYGVDYKGASGTPVYAVAAGQVISAGWDSGFGNVIEVRHDGNYTTQYAHLSKINVRRQQYVSKGAIIGAVGSTGLSTGPHLHFGLRLNGRWSNPANLRMAAATKLEGTRLADFQDQIKEIKAILNYIKSEVVLKQ